MHYTTAVTLALVSTVIAQSSPSLPACAEAAVSTAIQASGCSAADKPCICNSTKVVQSLSGTVPKACSEADQGNLQDYLIHFCSDQETASSSTVASGAAASAYVRADGGDASPDAGEAAGAPADAGSGDQAPAQAAPAATATGTTAPADASPADGGDIAPAATASASPAAAASQYPSDEGGAGDAAGDTQAATSDATPEVTSTTAATDVGNATGLPGSITAPSDSASVTSVVVSDTSSAAVPEPPSTVEPELTTAEGVSGTSSLPSTQAVPYPTAVTGSSGADKRVEYSQAALAGLTVVLVAIVGWVGMQ